MKKVKFSNKILSALLALLMVFTSFPMSSTYAAENTNSGQASNAKSTELGQVSDADFATIDNKNEAEIIVEQNKEVSLDWSAADATIGKNEDGWGISVKMTAPALSEDILKNSVFDILEHDKNVPTENESFWDKRNSTDTDQEQYINLWTYINEEDLNKALFAGENILNKWFFDWDNDNTNDQTVTVSIDPKSIILTNGNDSVYPSEKLGQISETTDKLNVENDKSNFINVSYADEVSLQWSQEGSSKGITKDGWWAELKMIAPNDADLENAKYRFKTSPKGNWVENNKFADDKDGDEYIILRACVENEEALKNGINTIWTFDWNNDGVYEQYINFKFNSTNVKLDNAKLYEMDKASPEISGLTDSKTYSKDDITVNFSVEDRATESNGKSYISGLKGVYYTDKKLVGADRNEANIISKLKADKLPGNSNSYSFTVSNDYNEYYYIYAIDNSGNIEEGKVLVQVDKTAPTFKDTKISSSDWTNKDVTITGKIEDNLSGIDKDKSFIETDAKNASFKYDETTGEYTITIPAQTFKGDITLNCFDKAGNKNSEKFSVSMDKTNCVIMSLNVSDTNWTNEDVKITGTVIDLHSGVDSVNATLKNGVVYNATYNKISDNEGSFEIVIPAQNYNDSCIVNAIDVAGNNVADKGENVVSLTLNLKMDNEKPEIKNAQASTSDWTNKEITVSVSVNDNNISGVDAVYYAKGDSIQNVSINDIAQKAKPATFNEKTDTYSFEIEKQNYDGNYVIYAVDNAGNISESETVAVKMDIISPSNLKVEYPETSKMKAIKKMLEIITFGFYKSTVTVKLTATDLPDPNGDSSVSGIKEYIYTVKNLKTNQTVIDKKVISNHNNGVATFNLPDDNGEYIVEFEVVDNALNKAEYTSLSEKNIQGAIIDKNQPSAINVDYLNKVAQETIDNKEKYFYSTDAQVDFNINEEYFFEKYASSIDKIEEEDVITLLNDIDINISKIDENGKDTEYYKGKVITNSKLFKTEFDEKGKKISVIIPAELDNVKNDGDYTIEIVYTDPAGNSSQVIKTDTIVIDKTAPKVEVEFDSTKPIHTIADDGREYYNTNRSATIIVNEHNFYPEYFETENILKAQNILGKEVTNYIKYLKNRNNWSSEGNIHTINIDFVSDANYTFDFEFEDLAKNKCNDYDEYLFTVDKTAPKNLKVFYSTNVYETVINAITFGYYDNMMNVTISADDETTGIYHFMYSYLTADGVSNVNAQLVNDAISRSKVTRNGKTSTSVFSIPKSKLERNNQFNGTVEFTAYDYAENSTSKSDTKRVIVDNISPTSTVAFNEPVQNVNNVSYYAGNIDATISVNEANFYSQDVEVIVTKDGSRYPVSVNWTDNSVDSHTGKFTLTEDGDYIVKIVYSDRSGNAMATYESNQLTIDTVDPVITVSGINHQSANNGETIGFSISVSDKNIALSEFRPVLTAVIKNDKGELETISISLGNPVTSVNNKGETVYTYTVQNLSVDGFYSLKCSAVDYANHSVSIINSGQDNGSTATEETMNFSVNRDGSTFWIETEHNDKYSDTIFSNKLDKAYANDTVEITVHELNVDEVNISNETNQKTVFALHDGSSTDFVALREGSAPNGNYVKNTLRGEGGWYETRYILNNDNFAHDGVYSFSILSYDRAGNSNLNTKDDSGVIKFTVDRTNPVITSNISENQIIDSDNYTVEFEVNDTNHDKNTVEVMLNGKPVPSESITNLGGNSYSFVMSSGSKQNISVTSKDLAGNTADSYEVKDVTVSTNRFILFYYSYTVWFWIIVAGVVLIACLILFIVFRKRKDKDKEEEN